MEDLWQEMTYLAYHLHWDLDRLLDLEHGDRIRMVEEVGLAEPTGRGRRFAMANVAQGNPNARTTDPPFAGAFKLEVGGVTIGAFTEVTGLAVQMEIEEIAEGGNNESTIKVPGRLKWPNLVLKRGITDNNSLFEWIAKCSGEGFEKRAAQDHPADRRASPCWTPGGRTVRGGSSATRCRCAGPGRPSRRLRTLWPWRSWR